MAIYTTSQSRVSSRAKAQGASTQEVALVAIVAVTTGMIDTNTDEVGLFYVPKGFMPTSINFSTTDMDSSTGLLWDVGDDGDEDRLIAAFSGQAAGQQNALVATTGFLYKYTARTLIKAYVNTAATGGAAGTLKVVLKGIVDEDFDTTPLVAA
jgi:hypothetical protein